MVYELNNSTIGELKKVKEAVVEFWSPWCMLCKASSKPFEELSNEHKNIYFFKVNVDEVESVKKEFDLKKLPTFVRIKNSNLEIKIEGYKDKTSLLQNLDI